MQQTKMVWVVLAGCCLATCLGCSEKATDTNGGPSGEWFQVEAEDFNESYDTPESERDIDIASCGSASGGLAVAGMDKSGEWIQVPLDISATGTYDVAIDYQSPAGGTINLRLDGGQCSGKGQVNFTLTPGNGTG